MLKTRVLNVKDQNIECKREFNVKDQNVECKRPKYWLEKRVFGVKTTALNVKDQSTECKRPEY